MIFIVKNNHRRTRREIARQFTIKRSSAVAECDKGHGRAEIRTLRAVAVSEHLAK
jgi:hypothetical protein